MSESYSESNAVPEQTLSAMAESGVPIFDSDQYAADQEASPAEISPDQLQDGEALAAITSRIRALPPLEAPDLDALITDPLLANRPAFQIRSSPYDYADKDNGNARMVPNAQDGSLNLVGKAGRTNGSQGDFVHGVCWTGIGVTNESAVAQPFQTVRISPIVSWEASWRLATVGFFGPWAQVRGGFDVTAWDGAGHRVGFFPPRDVFSVHHDDEGASWNIVDGADNGLVPDGKVFFSIPPGETRWVNVDAYIEVQADYSSVTSQAAAVASFAVTVRYIVLRPAAPGREFR
jgi:hypothetical protein